MAKIGLPKGSGKLLKVREKSVKSQGILKWILSGNPDIRTNIVFDYRVTHSFYTTCPPGIKCELIICICRILLTPLEE